MLVERKPYVCLLQETNDVFPGGKEYFRLTNLQKMLRMRQQYMVSQLSLLYPVKISAGPKQEQELESFPSSSKSGKSYPTYLACTKPCFVLYSHN